jgi:hypothetical protein
MPAYVRATVTRWIADEPFPGLVEVVLVDATGQGWIFVDKSAMFDPNDVLRSTSSYPTELRLACTVVRRTAEDVTVSTAEPWGLETTEGKSTFVMLPSQVEESPR